MLAVYDLNVFPKSAILTIIDLYSYRPKRGIKDTGTRPLGYCIRHTRTSNIINLQLNINLYSGT